MSEQRRRTPHGKPRPRYLRVSVDLPANFSGDGPGRVDVRVPLQLLRAGVRLTALIPPRALDRASAELSRSGVPVDLSQLRPEHLEDLVEHLDEVTVDVDQPDARVQLICE